MLQNTTHFNQDDFRALNFMTGLEKTHGVIKLKHVERDFHIVYDPMKPSKTHFVLGEMRMVKRKMTPRPKPPIKIKVRSKNPKRAWTNPEDMEFIIPISQLKNPKAFHYSVGSAEELKKDPFKWLMNTFTAQELKELGSIPQLPPFPIPKGAHPNCKMVIDTLDGNFAREWNRQPKKINKYKMTPMEGRPCKKKK